MHLPDRLTSLIPGHTTDTTPDPSTTRETEADADCTIETSTSESGESSTDSPDASGTEGITDGEKANPPDHTVANTGREAMHAIRVAPSGVRLETSAARCNDYWVKILFVTGFPESATPGLLDRICTHPSADVDVTIHTDPEDIQTSLLRFERAIKELKVDYIEAQDQGSAKSSVIEDRLRKHESVYRQLKDNAQRVLDVGVYLTIRGNSDEQVATVAKSIRDELQRYRLTTKTAAYRQDDALVSGCPVAKDVLGQTTPMLGQAAGALFPFAASTIIEESGVLYGYHSSTDAPVYVDRFQRKNGYNVLVAGEIGSGKTYDTKRLLLRRVAKDPETDIVMIDPVGDFSSLADSLDAEHYVIGGTRTVNPLEIRPTPEHLLDVQTTDPFKERINAVMNFFETFFTFIDAPMGDRRQVLERCVREAYAQKGITPDPDTHSRESPVIDDVREVVGTVAAAPTSVLNGANYSAGELDKWRDHAEDIHLNLEPFTSGGQFAFLNGLTEVDLTDNRVVYLDLEQFGRTSDNALAGLVMQPMFDAVYERLKTSTGKTIVAIDEAHYLAESPGSVEWLKRTTRHSRHLGLSLHFVTQELADFYDAEDAETFINQSSIKLLHRQGSLKPEHADALGLTDTQARFVRSATIGDDDLGYSHALLDIDEGGTYPLRVTALPEEESIIEGDESDDSAHESIDSRSNGHIIVEEPASTDRGREH